MKPLTKQVHDLLTELSLQGETVIDATAGNGHDTLFLAERVGSSGKVFAIDLQTEAIRETKNRLETAGYKKIEYLTDDHANLLSLLPDELIEKVAAITFNLGYLPGGNTEITTNITSTQQAIMAATKLLKPRGMITILAYTGHPGGEEEAIAVKETGSKLPKEKFRFQEHSPIPRITNAPRLFVITRKNR